MTKSSNELIHLYRKELLELKKVPLPDDIEEQKIRIAIIEEKLEAIYRLEKLASLLAESERQKILNEIKKNSKHAESHKNIYLYGLPICVLLGIILLFTGTKAGILISILCIGLMALQHNPAIEILVDIQKMIIKLSSKLIPKEKGSSTDEDKEDK